jgi:hypothetical protein
MKRLTVALLFLAAAFPTMAAQHIECRSIGGHHPYGRDISAARYLRIYGARMILTGRTGRHDMPRWSLPCTPTETGMFCSGRSRSKLVTIKTDGWQMKEMVYGRGYNDEIFHVVYNCNHELVLP